MAKVVVIIRNGRVAEAVEDIPTDMLVEVRNYDIANVKKDLLPKDNNGRSCLVKEWHAPE
jgi:hypothetical protein